MSAAHENDERTKGLPMTELCEILICKNIWSISDYVREINCIFSEYFGPINHYLSCINKHFASFSRNFCLNNKYYPRPCPCTE